MKVYSPNIQIIEIFVYKFHIKIFFSSYKHTHSKYTFMMLHL